MAPTWAAPALFFKNFYGRKESATFNENITSISILGFAFTPQVRILGHHTSCDKTAPNRHLVKLKAPEKKLRIFQWYEKILLSK